MINLLNAYMETLAIRVLGHNPAEKKMRHFVMGIEQIVNLANMQVPKGVYVMVQESAEMDTVFKTESKNPLRYTDAFMIVSHAPANDYVKQREVQERAFELGWEVIKLMQADFRKRFVPGMNEAFFTDFMFGNIHSHKVGPVLDQMHGYRWTFGGDYDVRDIQPNATKYQS